MGHSKPTCPTPGLRDEIGDLPFGPKLRAPDDHRKSASAETPSKEQYSAPSSQREFKNSSNVGDGVEVTSPAKDRTNAKYKGPPKQVYRQVETPPLLLLSFGEQTTEANSDSTKGEGGSYDHEDGNEFEKDAKKRNPHPIARQRLQSNAARPNELHQLELLGAWKPQGNSRDSQYCEARRA